MRLLAFMTALSLEVVLRGARVGAFQVIDRSRSCFEQLIIQDIPGRQLEPIAFWPQGVGLHEVVALVALKVPSRGAR